jgi:hypothetical protein
LVLSRIMVAQATASAKAGSFQRVTDCARKSTGGGASSPKHCLVQKEEPQQRSCGSCEFD